MIKKNAVLFSTIAALLASGATLAAGNQANINQLGSGNSGTATQENSANPMFATINQDGVDNNAATYQNDSWFASAFIEQIGDAERNIAKIDQTNWSDDSNAEIHQIVATWDSEAKITQNGSNLSNANITQIFGWFDKAYIYQSGGGNNASILQDDSWFSSASIEQTGLNNLASISQTNFSDFSTASIVQLGNDNEAHVEQNSAYASNADVHQEGLTQYAYVSQQGEYNNASVNQFNEGNTANVMQTGIGTWDNPNFATINQNGAFDFANINQAGGAGNTAVITQNF